MVVGNQSLLIFRIGVGQLAARVHIAAQDISKRIASKVARQIGLHDCRRTRLNFSDQAWTPLVEHQDHRFTGFL
ncbi:hypothetical protein SDC9_204465 [bioreactor metagenome]|uniref:Uncharacterized protein n=1 Tax=bioreactor metagenome TaxID=1076179 RepID=A0A645JB76_9ZZZZ